MTDSASARPFGDLRSLIEGRKATFLAAAPKLAAKPQTPQKPDQLKKARQPEKTAVQEVKTGRAAAKQPTEKKQPQRAPVNRRSEMPAQGPLQKARRADHEKARKPAAPAKARLSFEESRNPIPPFELAPGLPVS